MELMMGQAGVAGKPRPAEGDFRALVEELSKMPGEKRQDMYGYIRLAGKAMKLGDDKGFWEKMAEAAGRGTTDLVVLPINALADGELRRMKHDVDELSVIRPSPLLMEPGGPGMGNVGSLYNKGISLSPEEQEKMSKELEEGENRQTVERELRDLQQNVIDPIEPKADGVLGLAEGALYGLSRNAPMVVVGSLGGGGTVLMGLSMYGQEYERLRLQYPELNPETAQGMAMISAGLMTGLEKVQISGMFKGMPMTKAVVERLANRNIPLPERLGLTLSGNLAEQSLAELGQSFASLGVDSFFAALGADMPGFDGWKEMRSIIENAPQMVFQVTPMATIGTGFAGYRDFRGGARYTGDPTNLERAGFSEERAVNIAAEGDPEKRQRMIREEWLHRTEEDIKRGASLAMEGFPRLEEVPGLGEGFTPAEKNAGLDVELRREGTGNWIWGKAELLGRLKAGSANQGPTTGVDQSRGDLVDAGTVLSTEEQNSNIHTNGRRHLRKTLRNFPLTAELDEESRAVYRTRFASLLEQGRANSARLGVELRTLSETEKDLFYATPDERGEVKLYVHPLASEEFLGIAKGHRDAAEKLFKDAINEELIHAADLLADRDEWLRLPANKRGSFLKFVEQKKTARFHDLRMAREAATGRSREVIDGALVDAYRLYFEGKEEGRVIRTADGVLDMLERVPSQEVNHISFVTEFTRMLLQSRDSISEVGFLPFLEKVKAWVGRAVKRLRAGLTVAEAGDFGELMKSRLDEIDRMMSQLPGTTSEAINSLSSDLVPPLKSEGGSEGQSTFSIGKEEALKNSINDVALTELISFYEGKARKEGRELVFQSEAKAKSVEEFLTENPLKVEEIAERMRIAGLEGAEHSSVRILGETSLERLRDDVNRTTIRLYEGASAGTVVEEVVEGRVRDAISRGQVTLGWLRSEVEGYQRVSGEQLLTGTDQSVIEAVSTLGEAYFAGKVNEKDLPGPLLRMFNELAEFFREVFGRGLKLREAVRSGQVSERFETFLKESTGLGKPTDPILSPTGHEDWAAFTDWDEWKSGGKVKAMPVKLLGGVQMERHRGFGLEHIRQEHGQDLLRFSVGLEKFVQRALLNFNEAYLQSSGRILLFSRKPTAVAVVELRPEKGGFYSVVSAYPKDNASWVPAGEKIIGSRRKAFASFDSVPGKRVPTKYSWQYIRMLSQNQREEP